MAVAFYVNKQTNGKLKSADLSSLSNGHNMSSVYLFDVFTYRCFAAFCTHCVDV